MKTVTLDSCFFAHPLIMQLSPFEYDVALRLHCMVDASRQIDDCMITLQRRLGVMGSPCEFSVAVARLRTLSYITPGDGFFTVQDLGNLSRTKRAGVKLRFVKIDPKLHYHPRIIDLDLESKYLLQCMWALAAHGAIDGVVERKGRGLCMELCLACSQFEFDEKLAILVENQFLIETEEGYAIRNWEKHQTLWQSQTPEANRKRQQEYRARKQEQEKSVTERGGVTNVLQLVTTDDLSVTTVLQRKEGKGKEGNLKESNLKVGEGNPAPVTAQSVTPPSSSSSSPLDNFFGDSEIVTPRQERERENTPSAPPPVMPGSTPEYWRRLASAGWKPSEITEALAKMKTRKDPAKFTPDAMVNYLTPMLTDMRTRQGNSYQPPLAPPIDPEEAKKAKAVREAERLAWEVEQLADLDRKIEKGRLKREERERNEQAITTV